MEEEQKRTKPNILITGTPGTGKTTLSKLLSDQTGLIHLELAALINQQKLYKKWDEEFNLPVYDDDLVVDYLEEIVNKGGYIIDFHGSSLFPERWFDLVILLRTNNTILYDRLEARGYDQKKITVNIECEILEVTSEEVYDSYKPEIILELVNEVPDQMQESVEKIYNWLADWKSKNAQSS